MSFNRDEFKKSLTVLSNGDGSKDKAINSLVEVASILATTFGITETNKLQTTLAMIFPVVEITDSKEVLRSVINGENANHYTDELLSLLRDQDINTFLKKNYPSDKLKDTKEQVRFIHGITDLLELRICDVPISNPSQDTKNYLSDVLAISHLLQSEEVSSHLDELEKDLQAYAKTKKARLVAARNGLFKFPEKNEPGYNPKKPRDHQALLSRFFYDWAKDNGFTMIKVEGFMNPAAKFFKLIEQKQLFKDFGAGTGHGFWSHVIQFYIAKKANAVQHEISDVYSQLGIPSFQGKKIYSDWEGEKSINPFHAWDLFLDRVDGKSYRTPDQLTTLIENNKDRWPLLSASISLPKQKLWKGKKDNTVDTKYNPHHKLRK